MVKDVRDTPPTPDHWRKRFEKDKARQGQFHTLESYNSKKAVNKRLLDKYDKYIISADDANEMRHNFIDSYTSTIKLIVTGLLENINTTIIEISSKEGKSYLEINYFIQKYLNSHMSEYNIILPRIIKENIVYDTLMILTFKGYRFFYAANCEVERDYEFMNVIFYDKHDPEVFVQLVWGNPYSDNKKLNEYKLKGI